MLLYPHNEVAYEKVKKMIFEEGKVCIIHPTGTGKSFVGFQLCLDHPDDNILWIGPSAYIYQTQLENWRSAGGTELPNITFITYAKLTLLTEDEIAALQPDYIILDEFHRAGASEWGRAVQTLLEYYSKIKLLGLTATNIRYLDNQRDMAKELFDNCIASQMTLGEAIVLGILNPPKYVLSVFKYQSTLDKLSARIARTKSRASRTAAEEYFEQLRRALENASGLDEIFLKHIPDPHGKYLVFCSSAEHMDEMIARVPAWFSRIDAEPHVYRAYAEDPSTLRAFSAFKNDASPHLKLLFCIDMLNEGVHVEDVSGVILLRPTVSPIIYKQQIGRALSAGKKKDAVIFDVVLNIENLTSISSVQQEMNAAITYYRYLNEDSRIVNDHFEVIDETRDCRELFDGLEHSLNSSWDLMYAEAKQYYLTHGDLLIPAKYKTASGLSLGSWLGVQRAVYAGRAEGHLSDAQIARLNAIGIVWDSYHDLAWQRNYLAAKAYYEANGNLLPPVAYVTPEGIPLGTWVASMRAARANQRQGLLTPERIEKLDAIGMIWDNLVSSQWEKNYCEAVDYYREHGNLLVPRSYITPSGIKLGSWIIHLRSAWKGNASYSLTPEQIARLNAIGMVWDAVEEAWNAGYQEALLYKLSCGNLKVPITYKTPSGYCLGQWVRRQRMNYKNGVLSQNQVDLLEDLGINWQVHSDHWQDMFREAQLYYDAHGDLQVPREYVGSNGQRLGLWLSRQRRAKNKLSEEQIRQLDAVHFEW